MKNGWVTFCSVGVCVHVNKTVFPLDKTPHMKNTAFAKCYISICLAHSLSPLKYITEKQNCTFALSKFSSFIQGKTIVKLMNCY